MQIVLFPYDDHDDPSNPNVFESNVQWLKDHPSVRFYVDGYASSRGDWLYNLGLSQCRADWVKQALVKSGYSGEPSQRRALVGESRIPFAPKLAMNVGSKNRLVRFVYSPN